MRCSNELTPYNVLVITSSITYAFENEKSAKQKYGKDTPSLYQPSDHNQHMPVSDNQTHTSSQNQALRQHVWSLRLGYRGFVAIGRGGGAPGPGCPCPLLTVSARPGFFGGGGGGGGFRLFRASRSGLEVFCAGAVYGELG